MKKLLGPVIIAALALLCLTFLDRSCNSDAALVKAKADYAELKRITDADHALSQATLLNAEGIITQKDAAIAEKDAKIAQYVGKVSTLTAELTALQNAEPVQPELESQPLVINLRAQIGNLTNTLSISYQIIEAKDAVIADWSAKFNAQVVISEAWKASYDRERVLRIASEGLCEDYAHSLKANKLWATVGKYGPPVAFVAGIIAGK